MEAAPGVLLTVLGAALPPEDTRRRMYVVLRRPYGYLQDALRRAFEGQEEVQVMVDRRQRERRQASQPVPSDRRRSDRRAPTEELLQIVILRPPPVGNPVTSGR
jgi:hypothetical protein